jgi:hypothetical protein
MRLRLRCVKRSAAMASPFHVAIAAAAPDRADFPAGIGVVVAGRAARRRLHDPAALGGHEVAHVMVGELVARRFGHGDVVPRTTDNKLGSGLLAPLHLPRRTIERWQCSDPHRADPRGEGS